MNKIEQLKGYLGTGLKFKSDKGYERVMIGLTNDSIKLSEWILTDDRDKIHSYTFDVDMGDKKYKPLLHPLSRLTVPIRVEGYNGGEEFVPIVEIGKLFFTKTLEKYEVDGLVEYGWEDRNFDDGQGYSFGYWKDGMFGVWLDSIYEDEDPYYTHSSLTVIQLLYQWHFAIDIEEGDFEEIEI